MDRTRAVTTMALWTLYPAVCLVLMALRLMPHHLSPGGWPSPDLILCVTFAWVLRRPDLVPVVAVMLIGLCADLLYQRPPGVMAALMLASSELLRSRGRLSRPLLAIMEWGLIAILVFTMALAHWAIMGLTLVPHAPLRYEFWQAAVTVLSYPAVVWLTRHVGIRKALIVQGVIRKGR